MIIFLINGELFEKDDLVQANQDTPDAVEWLKNAEKGDMFTDAMQEEVCCLGEEPTEQDIVDAYNEWHKLKDWTLVIA